MLIDADTAWAGGIDDLIDTFESSANGRAGAIVGGVVEQERAFESDQYFLRRATSRADASEGLDEAAKEECYRHVFGRRWRNLLSTPQLNNGLLILQGCSRLGEQWLRYYERGLKDTRINPTDQIPLAAAVGFTDAGLVRLDGRFNSRGRVNCPYTVFHATGVWRDEFRAALAPLEEVSDYASIVRSIARQIQPCLLHECMPDDQQPWKYLAVRSLNPTERVIASRRSVR